MNDTKQPTFNDESLNVILDRFGQGEGTKQEAFRDLITWCRDHLAPFKRERGGVARGAVTGLRNHVETIDLGGLTTSYIVPSVTIASALIKGGLSLALEHIYNNLTDEGSGEGGEIKGPLYTPGRLNACWGLITKKEGSPFEVTMEGLMLKGKPFATYRIKDLKDLNAGPERTRSGIDLVLSLIGEDPTMVEDPSKAKPGTFGRALKDLREKNEDLNDEALSAFTDALEGFLEEQRISLSAEVAAEAEKAAAERRMAAEARRLERVKARNEAREPSTVVEPSDRKRKQKASEVKSNEG